MHNPNVYLRYYQHAKTITKVWHFQEGLLTHDT